VGAEAFGETVNVASWVTKPVSNAKSYGRRIGSVLKGSNIDFIKGVPDRLISLLRYAISSLVYRCT